MDTGGRRRTRSSKRTQEETESPAPLASRPSVRSSKRRPMETESPAEPASRDHGRSLKRRPTETETEPLSEQASRVSARLAKRRTETESESLADPGSGVLTGSAKKILIETESVPELLPDPASRGSVRSAKQRSKAESLADQGSSEPVRSAKKRLAETEMQADPRSAKREALVGNYVVKEPPSGTGRALLGKITSYKGPRERGVFKVVYEDGELENLGYRKLSKILMKDEGTSSVRMSIRKRKLDQLATTLVAELPPTMKVAESAPETPEESQVASEAASEDAVDVEDEVDEEDVGSDVDLDVLEPEILPPMPELPPSSGDIAVPEESISYLFSVYNFVRSFSRQLFLSPFSLDEFVGALNCNVQNSLLDALHFSLMRSLKRHLETMGAEESNFASKCLRYYDWTLLDHLTWPAFLVEYLYLSGYMKKMDKGDVNKFVARSDYYALPVRTKLKILQMLCDDILDVAELRAELEMRESMEVEKECDVGDGVPPESIAVRKRSRYSKTTTSKESEDAEPDKVSTDVKVTNSDEDAKEWDVGNTVPPEIIPMPKFSETPASKDSETMVNSSEPNKLSTDAQVIKLDDDAMDSSPDGNSDECCLCGMDGTLICCDGCPSAYHSRCISLNKVPEGLWYCPECSVNKLGQSTLRIGRGVRGAENFGFDRYGRTFQGTCNYLLVTVTSVNIEPIYRYYNQDDVTKVLSIISEGKSLSAYVSICRKISKYWEIPLINIQAGKTESITNLQLDKDPAVQCSTDNFKDVEGENHMNNIAESSADNREILSQNNDQIGLKVEDSALDLVGQAGFQDSENYDKAKHATSTQNISEVANEASLPQQDDQFVNRDVTGAVQNNLPFLQNNSSYADNRSAVSNVSNLSQPISVERSSVLEIETSGSANATRFCCEEAGSLLSKKCDSASISDESKQGMHIYIEKCRTSEKESSLSSFKPQAYVNLYIQGDIAASAAANLALLASEDNRAPGSQVNYNSRKVAAATAALQIKAFSGLAMHFLWPSYEKKLMEVPREKCGWCYACRCTYRRACLLNAAAANAMKVSARNISGFRPIKYYGSHLPIIAAHVGNMEETLQGLVIGPFLNAGYIQHWRKRVRGACGFRMLKTLLLELESNIRGIVFSGDWIKPVDDWAIGFFGASTGVSRSGLNPKRGPGKRSKKQIPTSASVKFSSSNSKKVFKWWRVGELSKTTFQKGTLHSSLSKKAARQGGLKRLPGITYPEGSEPIRRSRQFAWRASVQMSKNASQLALQVRYLDAHIRWRDLVPPDQSSSEGKGSDYDSAFRNAVIRNKRIDENQILYALNFENQKHLPVRLVKIIFETESGTEGEDDKLWFTEDHIPLYLIKQYEQKDGKKPSSSTAATPHHLLSSWRKRKSRGKDVFLYLMDKRDKPTSGPCASCQGDLLFRDAVTCKKCQGLCHKNCSVPSTVDKEDDLEFLFACNLCYAKPSTLVSRPKEASNAQMPLQMQNQQNTGMKFRLKMGMPQAARVIGDGLQLKPGTLMKTPGVQQPPRVQGTELATMKPPTPGGQQPLRGQGTQLATMKPPTLGVQQPLRGQGSQLATMRPPTLGVQEPPRVQGTQLITIRPPTHPFGPHSTPSVNEMEANPEMMSPVLESNSKRKGKREASQREPKREKNQTFGLIWRKLHVSQSGESFRQEHIILRSNMGQQSLGRSEPTCVLCKVPYSSDLMYVRCEACSDWYHADALNLEEAQLHDLMGFKCPKCRKTVRARCPYASDQINKKRKMESSEQMTKKAKKKATSSLLKVENPPTHLYHSFEEFEPFKGVAEMETETNGAASVLEHQREFNTPASSFEMEDLVISDSVDPLLPVGGVVDPLLPMGRVELIEPVPEFNGLGAVSQGQQKLTVRRAQVRPETSNASYLTEDAYSRSAAFSEIPPVTGNGTDANNFPAFDDTGHLGAPDTDQAGWDNFEEMKFDDVEYVPQANGQDGYEPHTYFSFSELLASEDEEIDMSGNQLSPTGGAIFQDPLSGTYADGATFGWDVCRICNSSDPSPDLTCQICQMHMHSHCSPWFESEGSSGSAQWRCGNCKDWQ